MWRTEIFGIPLIPVKITLKIIICHFNFTLLNLAFKMQNYYFLFNTMNKGNTVDPNLRLPASFLYLITIPSVLLFIPVSSDISFFYGDFWDAWFFFSIWYIFFCYNPETSRKLRKTLFHSNFHLPLWGSHCVCSWVATLCK